MYKIRNIKHQAILDSLVGTIALGCSEPLSKRTLKKLCIIKKWNKKEVLKDIKEDNWWIYFCDD